MKAVWLPPACIRQRRRARGASPDLRRAPAISRGTTSRGGQVLAHRRAAEGGARRACRAADRHDPSTGRVSRTPRVAKLSGRRAARAGALHRYLELRTLARSYAYDELDRRAGSNLADHAALATKGAPAERGATSTKRGGAAEASFDARSARIDYSSRPARWRSSSSTRESQRIREANAAAYQCTAIRRTSFCSSLSDYGTGGRAELEAATRDAAPTRGRGGTYAKTARCSTERAAAT